MTVIGITGPTGAGKTTVLKEIEALGGAVIDCDAVYHEMLESDRSLQESLERAFGPLRDGQGAIDRKKLGALVFGDPAKLERLNAIAQRAVVQRTRQMVKENRSRGIGLTAIDAFALLERVWPTCAPPRWPYWPRRRRGWRASWPGRAFRRTMPGPG